MFALFLVFLTAVSAGGRGQLIGRVEDILDGGQGALVELYQQHVLDPASSELTDILGEIHDYASQAPKWNDPKNVVVFLADDQGWSDIGFNDNTMVTPTADSMANAGVNLNSFYVQPTCSPTRASLVSGRSVLRTGLQDGASIPGEERGLPHDLATSGDIFKAAGYSTYFIGKWHLGHKFMHQTPLKRGYDKFFGCYNGAIDYYTKGIGVACIGSMENLFNPTFSENCQQLNGYDLIEQETPYVSPTDEYVTEVFGAKTVSTIMAHDENVPMLLHVHPTGPHTPLQAPANLTALCAGVSTAPYATQPYFRQTLCGMQVAVDITLFQVLLALTAKDMIRSTLILYASDNGGNLQAGSVNAPFRGSKLTLFEGGIRVPAFMYGSGLWDAPERTVDNLFDVSDVLPTMLAYAEVETDVVMDGYNHWAQLKYGEPWNRQFVEINAASDVVFSFAGYIAEEEDGNRWKYLYNPSSVKAMIAGTVTQQPYTEEGEYLFDLTNDPYETTNLLNTTEKEELILTKLRAQVALARFFSTPSALLAFPPPITHPTSPGGCWLPLDSPLFGAIPGTTPFICPTLPAPTPPPTPPSP